MLTIARTRTLTGILAAGFGALALTIAGGAARIQPEAQAQGVKVGDKAPDFTLTDIHGKEHKLSDYTNEGKIVVLEWFNPDCPFVKKFHYAHDTMQKMHAGFKDKPVQMIAINSASAPGKQGWGEERNLEAAEQYKIEYPILLDKDGSVGHAFGAKRTPHIFIVDTEGVVRYIGPIDSTNSAREVGTNYVEMAVNQILAGESEIVTADIATYGCAVKYATK